MQTEGPASVPPHAASRRKPALLPSSICAAPGVALQRCPVRAQNREKKEPPPATREPPHRGSGTAPQPSRPPTADGQARAQILRLPGISYPSKVQLPAGVGTRPLQLPEAFPLELPAALVAEQVHHFAGQLRQGYNPQPQRLSPAADHPVRRDRTSHVEPDPAHARLFYKVYPKCPTKASQSRYVMFHSARSQGMARSGRFAGIFGGFQAFGADAWLAV